MPVGLDFDGAVVIVTGASSGLGRAIAEEVARRGARAVAMSFVGDPGDGDEAADSVRSLGAEPIPVIADVADEAACRRTVEAVARHGRVDALFNNAGTTVFASDHADLDMVGAADFDRIFRVNVTGAYLMIRAARALLEAAPRPGAVVNTSSFAAFGGMGSSVPYAASKGALNTMTFALARALAPKIRVNAVCPGFMDSKWFKMLNQADMADLRENIAASVPMRMASRPEDIAGAAVFLASPAALHITGETLLVDAGLHLGPAVARLESGEA
jgi:NAD(P)-dependent dehydrogenase (short-subunit alcohol dehydrogenase family)